MAGSSIGAKGGAAAGFTASGNLQEGNIQGEGSGYLRPGALGLASLVLLLLTGVVLLCSDHPVGRGALPNSTDPRGMAPAASSSSAPIVAVDASAPLEVAAGPQ